MCGIVGYIGTENASDILINGLKKLEYRGYDSSGIAINTASGINIIKATGRISELEKKLNEDNSPCGSIGIGHTRWATHGAPNEINAHPHTSRNGKIAVVHNGIIENFSELREMLEKGGYEFVSQTDTEVIAHLFDYFYKGNLLDAMSSVMKTVRGSYALAVLTEDNKEQIIVARKDSPLIIGISENASFLASDFAAVIKYTRDCYLLDDGEIAVLKSNDVKIYNSEKTEIKKDIFKITWDEKSAEKSGYEYFMKKEIAEQPKAFRDTLGSRIQNEKIKIDELSLGDENIRNIGRIHIVACGSAWHVGTAAKYIFEELSRIPVEVDLASEFRYRNPIIKPGDICIAISQSGETADTLAALRKAKAEGAKTVSIVNVVASTIARESDDVIYTSCGPEIAVATTKALSSQLCVVYLLALKFAKACGRLSPEKESYYVEKLEELPKLIEKVLKCDDICKSMAHAYLNSDNIFFIGRGLDYAISLEGSLKLKEISYIHSDAYAAGELKHGTISLIEKGTPVIALATDEKHYEKMLGNIKEVKARGATVTAIITQKHADILEMCDAVITVPETERLFMPSLNVIPLQLFAYYTAVLRGCDVDKPRNLAKSVTVE